MYPDVQAQKCTKCDVFCNAIAYETRSLFGRILKEKRRKRCEWLRHVTDVNISYFL